MFGNKQCGAREAARISRDDAARQLAEKTATLIRCATGWGDGSSGAAGNVGGYNTFWIDNGNAAFEPTESSVRPFS